jgi:hypothetical protein
MMRKAFRSAVLCASLIALAGCSSTWSTSSVTRSGAVGTVDAAKPRTASDIRITEGDITDHKYRVIGDISVNVNKTTIFNSDPTREQIDEKLREKAMELNADAVILVRYGTVGIGLMSWGSLDGKGRAIAYTD